MPLVSRHLVEFRSSRTSCSCWEKVVRMCSVKASNCDFLLAVHYQPAEYPHVPMRMWPTHSWPRRSIFLAANRLQHQQLQQSCQFLVQETNELLCLWYMDWRLLLVYWTVSPAISRLLWNPLNWIRSIACFSHRSDAIFFITVIFCIDREHKEIIVSVRHIKRSSLILLLPWIKYIRGSSENTSPRWNAITIVVTQLCNVKLHESRKWYSFFQGYCFNNSILLSHRLTIRTRPAYIIRKPILNIHI